MDKLRLWFQTRLWRQRLRGMSKEREGGSARPKWKLLALDSSAECERTQKLLAPDSSAEWEQTRNLLAPDSTLGELCDRMRASSEPGWPLSPLGRPLTGDDGPAPEPTVQISSFNPETEGKLRGRANSIKGTLLCGLVD